MAAHEEDVCKPLVELKGTVEVKVKEEPISFVDVASAELDGPVKEEESEEPVNPMQEWNCEVAESRSSSLNLKCQHTPHHTSSTASSYDSHHEEEDLSHPWPHLETFFGPVISKKKLIERGRVVYRGSIACKKCKAKVTFNTVSMFTLKSHYQHMHPKLSKELLAAIAGGSRRGRPACADTRDSGCKRVRQAGIESFSAESAAFSHNRTQELFHRPQVCTTMERRRKLQKEDLRHLLNMSHTSILSEDLAQPGPSFYLQDPDSGPWEGPSSLTKHDEEVEPAGDAEPAGDPAPLSPPPAHLTLLEDPSLPTVPVAAVLGNTDSSYFNDSTLVRAQLEVYLAQKEAALAQKEAALAQKKAALAQKAAWEAMRLHYNKYANNKQ